MNPTLLKNGDINRPTLLRNEDMNIPHILLRNGNINSYTLLRNGNMNTYLIMNTGIRRWVVLSNRHDGQRNLYQQVELDRTLLIYYTNCPNRNTQGNKVNLCSSISAWSNSDSIAGNSSPLCYTFLFWYETLLFCNLVNFLFRVGRYFLKCSNYWMGFRFQIVFNI